MHDSPTLDRRARSTASSSPPLPYQDFVLISEFSEIEGPLPVAIVTDEVYIDLKDYCNVTGESEPWRQELQSMGLEEFDFNAFVLRVVSVDRNAEYERSTISDDNSSTTVEEEEQYQRQQVSFSIPDDTQIYFNDSESHFHAFTHHLSLFDINARGYVHPVALSYITRDAHKIMSRFEELMNKFNEVAIRMKQGNYSNFTRELKCRLLDLEYTRICILEKDTKFLEKETAEDSKRPSLPMRAVDQAITTTKLMIDTLEASITQMRQITAEKYSNNDTIPNITDERLQSTAEGSATTTTTEMRSTELPGDSEEDKHDTSICSIPADYTPIYVESLYPVPNFERKLRSLAQLCREQPDSRLNKNGEQREEKVNCSENENVDTVSSTATHRLMRQSSITQKTAAVIPLVFSMMEEAQQQQTAHNFTDAPVSTNLSNTITIAKAIKHDMYSETINCIQRIVKHLSKANIVLSLVEEENHYAKPISSALTIGQTFVLNFNNPPLRKDEASLPSSPLYKRDSPLDENIPNGICWFDRQHDLHPITEEEAKMDSYHSMFFSSAELWKAEKEEKLHKSILSILHRFQSVIVDVIFALMTGRTVVIEGSLQNKGLIEETVRVLSVFVPGLAHQQQSVIEWFDKGLLSNTEIDNVKLIGVDKQKVDSSIYINSSCVLDIDPENGSLNSGPVYVEGHWINQFVDRINLFSTGDAYLAYLHSVFMAISMKAFIYHHLWKTNEFDTCDNNSVVSSATFAESSKDMMSETNSESSTLSRRWSQRLMSYLRKTEAQQQQQVAAITDNDVPMQLPSASDDDQQIKHSDSGTTDRQPIDDYSDENQATVTLQSLQRKEKTVQSGISPRSVTDIFRTDALPVATVCTSGSANESIDHTTPVEYNIGNLSTTTSSRRASLISVGDKSKGLAANCFKMMNDQQMTMQDLYAILNADDFIRTDEDNENVCTASSYLSIDHSVSDKEGHDDHVVANSFQQQSHSDDAADIEQRGRQFLQDELKVYGDDQTIVIYLATSII